MSGQAWKLEYLAQVSITPWVQVSLTSLFMLLFERFTPQSTLPLRQRWQPSVSRCQLKLAIILILESTAE